MKKRNTLIAMLMVVAILILGVGYAALTGVNLTVGGEASATPSNDEFKVTFDNTVTSADSSIVVSYGSADTAGRVLSATLNVSGMSKLNDSKEFTFTIKNLSTDLSADLAKTTAELTGENAKYFTIETSIADSTVAPNGSTTLKVTVTLTKVPVENITAPINVVIGATPVEA